MAGGLRPYGNALFINDLVADRAPLAWLQDMIPKLAESDRDLPQSGLLIGRAIKE